jgi:hypothetical protein
MVLVERGKQPMCMVGALRATDKQQSTRTESKVKQIEHLHLCFASKIDEQVAAAHEIKP